ncbi:hypothetical protein [Deinococcus radiophilus]|uniref:hypothetical protein n=1 Tax=Deinococcus radiophilus TaxID=32062 RepID=UPI00360E5DEB
MPYLRAGPDRDHPGTATGRGRAALDQILRGRLAAEYFAPSFLSEIPAEELAALMDNLEAEYGPIRA